VDICWNDHGCSGQGCGVGGKISDFDSNSDPCKISDSPHRPFQISDSDPLTLKEWNLAVKINGNRGAQQEICFNKSFNRNCTILTGIPNLRSDVKNDPIEHLESDKKIQLRLPVLLGIRLHQKTPTAYDSNSSSDSEPSLWHPWSKPGLWSGIDTKTFGSNICNISHF